MSQYYYNPFGNNSDVNEAVQREYYKKLRIKQEKREIRLISLSLGCAIIAYLAVQLLANTFLYAFGLNELYMNNPVFQSAFTIIGVSFASVAVPFGLVALINKKRYISPVIPSNKLKASRAFAWICFGMACCCVCQIVVSYIVVFFETVLGLKLKSNDVSQPDSIFACVMNLIALAIVPAICEEFAMRCCSLQLLKKYGKGFAVVAVSIIFGILHGNAVQFIFAFVIGLILGFITVRTDSIVPAVFIHAFNNGMSVVQLTLNYAVSEKISSKVAVVIYLLWLVIGIISGVYLLMKKELIKQKSKCDCVLTTGQKFISFLFPWMIIPLFILIFITAQTITKI